MRCAMASLREACSVRKSSAKSNSGPSTSDIGVFQLTNPRLTVSAATVAMNDFEMEPMLIFVSDVIGSCDSRWRRPKPCAKMFWSLRTSAMLRPRLSRHSMTLAMKLRRRDSCSSVSSSHDVTASVSNTENTRVFIFCMIFSTVFFLPLTQIVEIAVLITVQIKKSPK